MRLAVHDNRQDDNGVRILEIRRQVNGPSVLLKYFTYLLCFFKIYVMFKVYNILYYTDAHLLLASVNQQDTGPLTDATKTSRCQVIALLCAIVIT